MTEQSALFAGTPAPRVLNYDPEAGILHLQPGEPEMCPLCRATEGQSWECGEADFYEMYCNACGCDYGVSVTAAS